MAMIFRHGANSENITSGVTEVAPVDSYFDSAANDSDKSWTVPNNELWKLCWAHAILTTSGDSGNRVMRLRVSDENGNELFDVPSAVVQAASTTRHYAFMQGFFRETAFVADELQVPIPADLYLKRGYVLRIYDGAAIAPAADDMTVSFQVKVYKGC